MAGDVAVLVSGVTKTFKIPLERRNRLREHVANLFRSAGYRRLDALKGVDIAVERGEFFGIIGRNGSGKSTLLKILAGIYQPTDGKVKVAGSLSPFIELGVGFNPELSARDNIFLNGAILGLDRKDVAAQFDDIIGFAELQDFVDQKLKNFSSGMLVRLAFSVAIRAHADVLLIDEVLAVGDIEFQKKCFDVFRRLKREGKTIIFVSHDLPTIKEFCDRVLVLDRGIAHGVFAAGDAIDAYHSLVNAAPQAESDGHSAGAEDREPRPELPSVRSVVMLTKDSEGAHLINRGDDVAVKVTVGNPKQVPINVGVAVYRSDGLYCFGTNTFLTHKPPPRDQEVEVEVKFSNLNLQRGNYFLLVGLFGDRVATVYEMRDHAFEFQVAQRDDSEGVIYLPHTWRV